MNKVILVHGFAQTARCWGHPVEVAGHHLVPVDLAGHGASPHRAASVERSAELLGDEAGPAAYLGYSFGGRVCLRLAVERPDLVTSLVLVSASPGLADPEERARRREADERLARDLERDGIDPFLDRWLALPLFAGLDEETRFVEERRRNEPGQLAASLRLAGTGSMEPLWDRLAALTMPVLVVSGEADPKFTSIGARMAAAIPDATATVIEGAGHSPHLERPGAFWAVVAGWLLSRGPTTTGRR